MNWTKNTSRWQADLENFRLKGEPEWPWDCWACRIGVLFRKWVLHPSHCRVVRVTASSKTSISQLRQTPPSFKAYFHIHQYSIIFGMKFLSDTSIHNVRFIIQSHNFLVTESSMAAPVLHHTPPVRRLRPHLSVTSNVSPIHSSIHTRFDTWHLCHGTWYFTKWKKKNAACHTCRIGVLSWFQGSIPAAAVNYTV